MPKKVTFDEYIQRLNHTHHNTYDYTLLPADMSTSTRIRVLCKVHGEFTPTLSAHLQGSGCPRCNWGSKKAKTQQKLIERATLVHNNRYDYSQVTYTDKDTPVTIVCPSHGPFAMRLWNHAYGPDKCPLCGAGKRRTTDDFITLAREVHGDRYDYSITKYVRAKDKVDIICPQHGVFSQTPDSHCLTTKQGCPKCKASTGERDIYKWLRDHNITDFVCEKTFIDCVAPDTMKPLRFDFFLPSHNLLIEFDGHAHFQPVNYSGTMTANDMNHQLARTQMLDALKDAYAIDHNIKILRIPHTEQRNIPTILEQHL